MRTRNAAETEQANRDLVLWRTAGSEEIGELIGKKYVGKMYLGQVVAWAPAGSVQHDEGKDWYMVRMSKKNGMAKIYILSQVRVISSRCSRVC